MDYCHLWNILAYPGSLCSCKATCLEALAEDSIGQANIILLLAIILKQPSIRDKMLLFRKYAKEGTEAHPFAFVDEDTGHVISLCRKATVAIFCLEEGHKHSEVFDPTAQREFARQRRISRFLSSTAAYISMGPHMTMMGSQINKIDWKHNAYADLVQEKTKAGSEVTLKVFVSTNKLGPWNGLLTYAVLGSRNYKQLITDLGGAHCCLRSVLKMLLCMEALSPPTGSKAWNRVNKTSVNAGSPKVLYQLLGGLSLRGTFVMEFKSFYKQRTQEVNEWTKEFETICARGINSIPGNEGSHTMNETVTSFLKSPSHGVQNPHYDFTLSFQNSEDGRKTYLGFTPLTEDGMFLQVWKGPGHGELLYIPFGSLVILPATTMHGGGFCSRTRTGNLRLHFYFYLDNVAALLGTTNVYGDKDSGDYSTTYLDAKGLDGGGLSKLFSKFAGVELKQYEDSEAATRRMTRHV